MYIVCANQQQQQQPTQWIKCKGKKSKRKRAAAAVATIPKRVANENDDQEMFLRDSEMFNGPQQQQQLDSCHFYSISYESTVCE